MIIHSFTCVAYYAAVAALFVSDLGAAVFFA